MGNFLKENWLWIVTPVVVVAAVVLYVVVSSGGSDPAADFTYNLR